MAVRLDKVLSELGVASRRELKQMIRSGRVSVNGKVAKASYDVKIGDVIEIGFGQRILRVRVTDIRETVKKDAAADMYEVLN